MVDNNLTYEQSSLAVEFNKKKSKRRTKTGGLHGNEKNFNEEDHVTIKTVERKWAVCLGEVATTENIAGTPIASKPIVPTSTTVIGAQEALLWAFCHSNHSTSTRFTIAKADECTVMFNFDSMKIEIRITRYDHTLTAELDLNPSFMISKESYNQKLEFKLLDLEDCRTLAEEKKKMNYLHWAVRKGDVQSALLSIERVTEVDATDSDGNTALQLAAAGSLSEVVKALIAKGAAVNYKNRDNNTSFHLAILNDGFEMAMLLLENNARIDFENNVSR